MSSNPVATLAIPHKYNNLSLSLTECFDRKALIYMIQNIETLPWESQTDIPLTKTLLKKYLGSTTSNKVVIKYRQCDHKTGRYFAEGVSKKDGYSSPSLQGLARKVRHTIARKFYMDIDIENCHPNILSQKCKSHNFLCPELDYYIKNREKVFKTICEQARIQHPDPSLKIDKSHVKTAVISIINGGSKLEMEYNGILYEWSHPWFDKLKAEIAIIHLQFVNLYPKYYESAKAVKVKKGKIYNINGSTVNHMLCDIENHLMMTIVDILTSKGYTVSSYQFDGCLINIDARMNDAVLTEVSNELYDQTGYRINLKIKPMDEGFHIPESIYDKPMANDTNMILPDDVWAWSPENLDDSLDTYSQMKIIFEKYNFMVHNPLMYCRLDRGSNKYTPFKKDELQQLYSSWIVSVSAKGVETTFISKWLKDPSKRCYETVNFCPPPLSHNLPESVYNTFKGFAASQIQDEPNRDMSVMLEFTNLIANNNAGLHKYFIEVCAQWLQRPADRRSPVALFIHGDQGIGKSTFFKWFGEKIIGHDYYHLVEAGKEEQLFGKFAGVVENKTLIVIDESASLVKYHEQLNGLITGDKISIELKGKMPYKINNNAWLVITSNHDNVVKIESGERRWVVNKMSNAKKGDVDYFTRLNKWMDDPKNQRGFYEFLMNIDLTEVVLQRDRPITEYYMDVKINSSPIVVKFLIQEYNNRLTENDIIEGKIYRNKFREYVKTVSSRELVYTDDWIAKQLRKCDVEMYHGNYHGYKINWTTVKDKLIETVGVPENILFPPDENQPFQFEDKDAEVEEE